MAITVTKNSLFPKRRDGQIASTSNRTTMITGGGSSLAGVSWSGDTLVIEGNIFVSGDTRAYGDVMAYSSNEAPINWWDALPAQIGGMLGTGLTISDGLLYADGGGGTGTSQWTDVTGGISYTGGNVGISYDKKIWSKTSDAAGYNAGITLFNGSGNMVITNNFGVSSTAGRIDFQTSNVNDTPVTRMSITKDGGVAIGSTNAAGRTFHVTGNMTVTQGAIINDIKVNRSTGGANYPSYPDIYATSGGIVIGGLSNGTGTVSFATTGSATLPSMHIDTAGTVKINSGNLVFENNLAEKFIRGSKNGGAIRLRSNMAAAEDRGIQLGQVDNLGNWAFTFLDLQEGGNKINGNTTIAGNSLFRFTGGGAYEDLGSIKWGNVGNTAINARIWTRRGGANYGQGALIFETANDDAGPVERMRIHEYGTVNISNSLTVGGNVGIGTASVAALAGTTGQVIYHSSTPGLSLQNSSAYYLQYMSAANLRWYNGAERMELTNAGNLRVTGEVTSYSSSDARLKQNIKPITSALETINKLQPVTYNWNDKAVELNDKKDTCTNNFGLIAQELEKVAPELVHNIYDEYKAIDYVQLVPILVQAVKEQQIQIDELKKK